MALKTPPFRFLAAEERRNSVILSGYCLNLMAIAEELELDHGYLSAVCSGRSEPSLKYARKLAGALGWTIDQLMKAIDERRAAMV